jgi:hypothetical protein
LLDEALSVSKAVGPDRHFKQAKQGLGPFLVITFKGAGIPGLGLGKVVTAEVKLGNFQLLGRSRLDAFSSEERFKGFTEKALARIEVSEANPHSPVLRPPLKVGDVLGHRAFAIACFEERFSCVKEVLGTLWDLVGDFDKGHRGEDRVSGRGIGEGQRFHDVDALGRAFTALLKEPDGPIDLARVKEALSLLELFLERRLFFPAAGK